MFHEEPESDALSLSFEAPSWFDQDAYLLAHEDVAAGVACGAIRSAYEHYINQGWREHRQVFLAGEPPRNQLFRWRAADASPAPTPAGELRYNIEHVVVSPGGGLFIVGWVDDLASPLERISLVNSDWMFTFAGSGLVRSRRADVEQALGATEPHSFGFFGFCNTTDPLVGGIDTCLLVIRRQDGAEITIDVKTRRAGDLELRDLVLNHLAMSDFYGNHQVAAIRACASGFGKQIAAFNCEVSRGLVQGAYVKHFGSAAGVRASLMVCLYGRAEFVFLQNALFAGRPGFGGYEIVWVSNSPELAERLMAEVEIAHGVYGVPQTLVLLPGNAGFGAANNAAAAYARSRRIIAINPDVFPRDLDWARKHLDLVDALPASQTRLFGVPLYYDDGSLMHGGMYFEFDTGVSIESGVVSDCRLIRVEHYGKGTPATSERFTRARPVPAVTGAFISCDRDWYENLGGFSEEYIFGSYEDADLCLKSLTRGTVPWLHDVRLWHLEGKGSTRLPVHEGGWVVNRWLFADRWAEEITHGLLGPEPARLAAAGALAEAGE